MHSLAILLGFLASATAVVIAGVHLARGGDVIAARTRLGGLWVGAVFLAIATSLPELTTDIAAVRFGVPDLAAGDLFGSTMANMLILALLSMMPRAELFRKAALDNSLTAALAIILTAIAAMFILLHLDVAILRIGTGSLALAVVYVVGMRTVYKSSSVAQEATVVVETEAHGQARAEAPAPDGDTHVPSLRNATVRFCLAAMVIFMAAPFFASSAKALAEISGIGTTFVGTWLVGFATSLPELVTCIAAVRLGAYDLAVGNLYGSNAVNMVIFVALDLAHGTGPVLAAISQVHALTALVGIALMALGLAAIVARTRRRFTVMEPSSLVMVLLYALGLGLVYLRSRG